MGKNKIIETENLSKYFSLETGFKAFFKKEIDKLKAVNEISIKIQKGEIFGLAGESGCGKTTTGKLLVGLLSPTKGKIKYKNRELNMNKNPKYREKIQMVFQDPFESINDRFTIKKWVEEPLIIQNKGKDDWRANKVKETLKSCGLNPPGKYLDRFPHELSGGELQRVIISRAMVLDPEFIVADEPTSMLDVSLKAEILKLIKKITKEKGVTTFYISHNLALLRIICDRIAIMYKGNIMEMGAAKKILFEPLHPYTKALIAAVPKVDPNSEKIKVILKEDKKSEPRKEQHCLFFPRCTERIDKCKDKPPSLIKAGNRLISCHKIV